jgi:ribonuclease HII
MGTDLIAFEKEYWLQNRLVCGIDEAGRGPLCGPIVVCGVVFPKDYYHPLINDSKQLSDKLRKALFMEIIQQAVYYQFEIVTPEEVDRLNVYQATKSAMLKIAMKFGGAILTDAMPLEATIEYQSLIKGDCRSISIAAASICAKVVRDHIMLGYHHLYPQYGYDQHKGYPTPGHLARLKQFGPQAFYRFSYGPVAKAVLQQFDLK